MGCFYLEGNHGEADLFVFVSADQRGGQEDACGFPLKGLIISEPGFRLLYHESHYAAAG